MLSLAGPLEALLTEDRNQLRKVRMWNVLMLVGLLFKVYSILMNNGFTFTCLVSLLSF